MADIVDNPESNAFPHLLGWVKKYWSWLEDRDSPFPQRDMLRKWMGRILVTVIIVALLDIYNAYAKQEQKKAEERHETQEGTKESDKSGEPVCDRDVTTADTTKEQDEVASSKAITDSQSKNEIELETKKEESSRIATKASLTPKPKAPSVTQSESSSRTIPKKPIKSAAVTKAIPTPPRIKATSNKHPGMEGFAHWYEVETSLYRIYTLTHQDPSIQTVPPYVPQSQRGNVPIELHVTNNTNRTISVFWVDFKGKYIHKGHILGGGAVWTQTTWIDHPWVFEDAETSTAYLHYVPYRAIPTTSTAQTIGTDETTGLHKFALIENSTSSSNQTQPFHIGVEDDIMPFPGISQLHAPLHAINWTLEHMSRVIAANAVHTHSVLLDLDTLQKYLLNIVRHPDNVKYRQLRIASPRFRSIWASHLKGVLLAVGFVEVGGYAELGCHDRPLSPERIQDVALLSYLLNRWKENETCRSQSQLRQPQGASDGYGRAGFGRAGAMGS